MGTNAIGPLRGVFELAYLDGLIPANPAARLRARPSQKSPPDPFSAQEMRHLLAWIGSHRPAWGPYFRLAFATGLRTSELLALTWGDIDWATHRARIQRAKVRKETKGTKTATVRDVELVPEALAALRDQKPATFLRGELVFLHHATGEAINDDKPPRLVMGAALRALGIRHRPTYNTRHTFATLAIMAGANPLWLSRQLGHTTPQTTFRAYAHWIDAAASQAEAQKIGAIFGEHAGEHPDAPRPPSTESPPSIR